MKLDRFLNVARYNLAINRAQYLKMALSLFLVMAMPFLTFVMKSIWAMAITKNVDIALSATIPGSNLGGWMAGCFLFAMPIICGYMFHNLLTKQSRIKELTLPASNGEKFLFHALMTVGGAFVAYIVSFLLIDLLQYLYVGVLYGFGRSELFAYRPVLFDNPMHVQGHIDPFTAWIYFIGRLGWVAYFSTFILGNAIKYKHNVLWTYVFHAALGFVSMLCLGMAMPLLIDLNWDWLHNVSEDQAITFIKVTSVTFFSLVTLFCWWFSYRLFCRAQITTKRNK